MPSDAAAPHPKFPPLVDRYLAVRAATEALAAPLSPEDQQAQSMPDASPTKWHLAHTTWFFEEFVLQEGEPGFAPHDERFRFLFNSYYEAVGPRLARPSRGLITRPTLSEVMAWRRAVDARVVRCLAAGLPDGVLERLVLGLHHEQQHQELLLTDALHLLAQNPLAPVYGDDDRFEGPRRAAASVPTRPAAAWRRFEGGLAQIGAAGSDFTFDNERPRHRVVLETFELATRLVTQGEFAAFVDAGGYREPRFWLAEGWDWVRREGITAPAYWRGDGSERHRFTLRGLLPLESEAPLAHVSYFEAEAFARFAGARLPTEQEWEHAARSAQARSPPAIGRAGAGGKPPPSAVPPELAAFFAPPLPQRAAKKPDAAGAPAAAPPLLELFGEAWQWTASPYVGYPGYRTAAGAIGEYNGKFMVNQQVLRGSSRFTPEGHARLTYRNFFPATARWQRTGLRLAREG